MAITDAKTNFFIQCSWELPKWRSIFKHSLAENATVQNGRLSAGVMGKQYHGFLGGLQRIIESRALRDKQSCKGKEYSVRPTAFQSPDCAPPRRITI
jgi:hypothetical protein